MCAEIEFNMSSFTCSVIENRHSSCSLQEGEWPDQGERQTPGDGGASHSPVQGESPCERWLTSGSDGGQHLQISVLEWGSAA